MTIKVLSPLEDQLVFSIFDERININTDLPFSWKIFFLSSLLISIGNILYSISCPELIKKYKNSVDYESQGGTPQTLKTDFINHLEKVGLDFNDVEKMKASEYNTFIFNHFKIPIESKSYDTNSQIYIKNPTEYESLKSSTFKDWSNYGVIILDLKTSFFDLRTILSRNSPNIRYTNFLFYSLGLALVFIVTIQNILFALRFILGTMFT